MPIFTSRQSPRRPISNTPQTTPSFSSGQYELQFTYLLIDFSYGQASKPHTPNPIHNGIICYLHLPQMLKIFSVILFIVPTLINTGFGLCFNMQSYDEATASMVACAKRDNGDIRKKDDNCRQPFFRIALSSMPYFSK